MILSKDVRSYPGLPLDISGLYLLQILLEETNALNNIKSSKPGSVSVVECHHHKLSRGSESELPVHPNVWISEFMFLGISVDSNLLIQSKALQGGWWIHRDLILPVIVSVYAFCLDMKLITSTFILKLSRIVGKITLSSCKYGAMVGKLQPDHQAFIKSTLYQDLWTCRRTHLVCLVRSVSWIVRTNFMLLGAVLEKAWEKWHCRDGTQWGVKAERNPSIVEFHSCF